MCPIFFVTHIQKVSRGESSMLICYLRLLEQNSVIEKNYITDEITFQFALVEMNHGNSILNLVE